MSDLDSEVLVSIQLRFPAVDSRALAAHLAPIITEAIQAGGNFFTLSIGGYEPDEDEEP